MQFWYEFRCTFHVEFISFIVCFISSLQKILKISVSEFKNVGCDFGNCQWFNPAKLHKVIVLWPMICQELKSASVLIVGPQTRSKWYIASELIYQGIDGTAKLYAGCNIVWKKNISYHRFYKATGFGLKLFEVQIMS